MKATSLKFSHWLSPLLEPGEDVYQLSGNDLALRLNTESHQERITALDSHLKQFRFFWDGMPMQPQIGVSYCYVRSPVNHIYLLLGELNTVAELSIVTNVPENMQLALRDLSLALDLSNGDRSSKLRPVKRRGRQRRPTTAV